MPKGSSCKISLFRKSKLVPNNNNMDLRVSRFEIKLILILLTLQGLQLLIAYY